MKKFVFTALLAAGASLALYSCNNGAYDAEPGGGAPLNPLNPSQSGVHVYLGTMKANVNGTTTLFYPAYYGIDDQGTYHIVAFKEKDPDFMHTLRFTLTSFNSIKSFKYSGIYTNLDTSKHSMDSIMTYEVTPTKGNLAFTIDGNEEGNLRGHFSGTLYKTKPQENLNDVVIFTDGEYYIPKKPL